MWNLLSEGQYTVPSILIECLLQRCSVSVWDFDDFGLELHFPDFSRLASVWFLICKMHGVRRERPFSKVEFDRYCQESARVADLIRRALVLRHETLKLPLSDDFLKRYSLVESALLSNPDEYTLWTFRREVLLLRTQSITTSVADDLWKKELNLTSGALRNHPKAYPAWQHRLWLLKDHKLSERLSSNIQQNAVLEEEHLSRQMLMKDPRNFHIWAHRMRVRSILSAQSPLQAGELERSEFAFVENKINDDFANYSAWHRRSVLLPRIHFEPGPNVVQRRIREELHYVRQAFYTEPDVQSMWFYHRWLLAGAPVKGAQVILDEDVLKDELNAFDELLQLEPDAKYALQTKAHILQLLGRYDEALECLNRLIQVVSFIYTDLIPSNVARASSPLVPQLET